MTHQSTEFERKIVSVKRNGHVFTVRIETDRSFAYQTREGYSIRPEFVLSRDGQAVDRGAYLDPILKGAMIRAGAFDTDEEANPFINELDGFFNRPVRINHDRVDHPSS